MAAHNKQLERTVIRLHVRAASAPFDYALAARITRQPAAQLRRLCANGSLRYKENTPPKLWRK